MNNTQHHEIIPSLYVNEQKVVTLKGKQQSYAGDPTSLAAQYSQQGADALIFIDLTASSLGSGPHLDWIRPVIAAINIPLIVGGGIQHIDHIEALIDIGASKIIMGTISIADPNVVLRASRRWGSSRIIVALDIRRNAEGSGLPGLEVVSSSKRATGMDLFNWLKMLEQIEPGAILLKNVNNEGSGKGYDVDLIQTVTSATSLPVMISGGAGKPEHFHQALQAGNVSALVASSALHSGKLTIPQIRQYLQEQCVSM